MLKIGQVQDLEVKEVGEFSSLLEYNVHMSDTNHEVGDQLKVFVYNDGEDLCATTEHPFLEVGGFETLVVSEINMVGAFCNIGTEKELFIPYKNQTKDMIPNRKYVVHMYLDELTNRLVGTAKVKPFLVSEADETISFGQEVDLIIYAESQLGYMAIINQKFDGLIYESEMHGRILRHGEKLKGYIKPIREDGKIDLSLTPLGHKSIEPNAKKILEMLKAEEGYLPFNDKSDPEAIRNKFGLSKKLFKKAIGGLYKDRLIVIETDGIKLV